MKIKIENPYYEKTIIVNKKKEHIEKSIEHIVAGNEDFLVVVDDNGNMHTISPAYCAHLEVLD